MKPVLVAALIALSAAPALAQPRGPDRGPERGAERGPGPGHDRGRDGGADPRAPDAYAGRSKDAFYAVMQQIDAAERQVRRNPRAMREVRSIRAFANQQQARHGELRDWDREAINTRLARILPRG